MVRAPIPRKRRSGEVQMFGMSMMELFVIGLVALLILGPNELPKVAKTLGKAIRDFRKAGDDLRDQFEREVMHDLPPKPVAPPPEAIGRKPPGSLPTPGSEDPTRHNVAALSPEELRLANDPTRQIAQPGADATRLIATEDPTKNLAVEDATRKDLKALAPEPADDPTRRDVKPLAAAALPADDATVELQDVAKGKA